jgi:hypothetical protein
MSWPARTWVTAELVTASIMNSYVRDPFTDVQKRAIAVTIGDPIGPTLSSGVKAYLEVPFPCNVTGWTLLANQSGNIQLDVWKDTYAAFPPTVADTITGSEKPALSGAQKAQDLALSTWTVFIAAGSILAINIDAAVSPTVKQVTLTIRVDLA